MIETGSMIERLRAEVSAHREAASRERGRASLLAHDLEQAYRQAADARYQIDRLQRIVSIMAEMHPDALGVAVVQASLSYADGAANLLDIPPSAQ